MLFNLCSKTCRAGKRLFKNIYNRRIKRMNGFVRCASTEYEAMLQNKNPKRMTEAV
jgi:hypothetical protein